MIGSPPNKTLGRTLLVSSARGCSTSADCRPRSQWTDSPHDRRRCARFSGRGGKIPFGTFVPRHRKETWPVGLNTVQSARIAALRDAASCCRRLAHAQDHSKRGIVAIPADESRLLSCVILDASNQLCENRPHRRWTAVTPARDSALLFLSSTFATCRPTRGQLSDEEYSGYHSFERRARGWAP